MTSGNLSGLSRALFHVELTRFDAFVVDLRTGELTKHGIRLKLAEQPFRVLAALLENAGELVTREELQRRIWPDVNSGDFEQGLNRAVNKVREALSDTAVNPRFIETLPGRGYRFIGTIERPEQAAPAQPRTLRKPLLAGLAVAAVVLGIGATVRSLAPPVIPELKWRKLTTDNYGKVPPALTDGRYR